MDHPMLPGPGHNSGLDPILDADLLRPQWAGDYAALLARRDLLLAAAEKFHILYPDIRDDETQGKAAEFVAQLKAAVKVGEAARTATKAPYHAMAQAVDAYFKAGITDALFREVAPIEDKQTAYARAKLARERAAAEAAARKAREAAQEAAEAARRVRAQETAAAQPPPTVSLFRGASAVDLAPAPSLAQEMEDAAALAAAQAHQAERRAMASDADLARSRGALGAVASMRKSWTYRVVDKSLIPAEYLLVDDRTLRALAKAQEDRAKVPGIEFFNDSHVSSIAR